MAEALPAPSLLAVGTEIDCPYGRLRLVAVPSDPALTPAGSSCWAEQCAADAIYLGAAHEDGNRLAWALLGGRHPSPARKAGNMIATPLGLVRIVPTTPRKRAKIGRYV